MPGYARLTRPLSSLLQGKNGFSWGPEQDSALSTIKKTFAALNPLNYMDPENTKEFIIITDASGVAIGAQLLRVDLSGQQTVISNVSRALSGAETRYSNMERELLAIVWALHRLELLIGGKPVTVHTDHAALLPILLGSTKMFPQLVWKGFG